MVKRFTSDQFFNAVPALRTIKNKCSQQSQGRLYGRAAMAPTNVIRCPIAMWRRKDDCRRFGPRGM